ncbi:uncharacterized protein METZ01_LOCUS505485, partial [marine metagenome]
MNYLFRLKIVLEIKQKKPLNLLYI